MDNAENDGTVEFPLRGEWTAVRTPAYRIPSHGTDQFGQRYAFDFVRMKWEPFARYFSKSKLHHMFSKVSVEDCYCWSQPIYSPFEGEVVTVLDDWPDIIKLNVYKDMFGALVRTYKFLRTPKTGGIDIRPITGNCIIIHSECFSALLAHLRNGSIKVKEGQHVKAGDFLAEVGNSGNTTAPHLHFQLMKGDDPLTAIGLPCRFRSYERYRGNAWETVTSGIPGRLERIRYQVE
jgi:hypothetical protein